MNRQYGVGKHRAAFLLSDADPARIIARGLDEHRFGGEDDCDPFA